MDGLHFQSHHRGSKAHQPKPEWVQSLIDQARGAGVKIFLKDNLKWKDKIQEYPAAGEWEE